MNTFRTVFEAIEGRALTDLLVAGYTDHDGQAQRFHPMFDDVYLDFGGRLVRASSAGQFWTLELALVERIEPRFALEDDDAFAVSSIAFVLAHPEGDNRLVELRAFTAADDAAHGRPACCGAAFVFAPDAGGGAPDLLFLDPRNRFGIHVRGREGLAAWQAERRDAGAPVDEQVLRRGAP